jgi:hypothetical protein
MWVEHGDTAGDYFGFSVAGNGDLNLDGKPDIMVGAMLADRVLFYQNYPSTIPSFFRASGTGTDYGRSVCFIEDKTGDGSDDGLIGQPGYTAIPGVKDSCGRARIEDDVHYIQFSHYGEATGDKLGYCVSNAGDADGDGFDDVIAGAPEAAGTGAPFMGYALLLSPRGDSVIHRFGGLEPNSRFGHSVSGAGDIDHDHKPDVIIGAPLATRLGAPFDDIGAAYVYTANGTMLWRFSGENSGDYFGNSVANAGDVNNDGVPDILVGAWRADPGGVVDAGSAFVYSGSDGSLIHRRDGEGTNHNFGYSVRGLGDIDGDSYDDFIVGAHRADLNGKTDAGAVYVYSGQIGNLLWVIVGANTDDIFGVSVSAAGDMTLDGRPDFLVGAFGTDPEGRVNAGSAYLFGCACNCTYNGDPAHDGVTDVLDVVATVSDAFRGDPNDKGADCIYCDSDINCSGACDVIDVVKMVNVAFRGADKETEFCDPCP